MITENDRNDCRKIISSRLAAAKAVVLAEMKQRLIGSDMEHFHVDEPQSWKFVRTPVTARIVDVSWSYEDELAIEVVYQDPHTGEDVRDEAHL